MFLSLLKKLAIVLFYVFQVGNLILLFYAFTHRQNSYPTPDTVVCYDFETVTGKRYHVKYSDWKNIRRHHWYNNTEVPDSIFDECLNLNKQQSTGIPTLYLPTCITSSIDVYQFWDGTMNPYCPAHVDFQSFKNTRSSGNSIIYMASDVLSWPPYLDAPTWIESEEIYIIRPKNDHLADIINLKRKPSYIDVEDIDQPIFRRMVLDRDLQMNVFFNVPYHATVFHQTVNHQLPVDEYLPKNGGYLRVWANPLMADSHELRVAIALANHQFEHEHVTARATRNGHSLLEIFSKYAYSESIYFGCIKIWKLPEKYQGNTHLSARKKWTFFTFNTPLHKLIWF